MITKKKRRTKLFSLTATFIMAVSLITPGMSYAESKGELFQSVYGQKNAAQVKMSDRLKTAFTKDDKVTFLVKFKDKADTQKVAKAAKKEAVSKKLTSTKTELMQRSVVVSELKATSIESQQAVKAYLQQEKKNGKVVSFNSYYIVNGMAVTATEEVAEKLSSFAEVEKILPNEKRELFTTVTKDAKAPQSEVANVEWNVERVGAPQVWDMGIDGTGTVVASIDTGVQWDHPALKEKYRGYDSATGEVTHDYNWFDATAGQGEAYDDQGHGTHVTGTMVGSEPDGSNQVGVAPGAKWIAVKAFTADGGTDVDLLEAAEWILAPKDSEGNARVDLAPDVVNNSWGGGPGLDEWYRDVVINWRAAQIFPEFSAGNTTLFNPGGPGSVAVPANYPESFATGATDINDTVAGFSLRGPSPYDEVKPDISAPGANIRSSVPGSGYEGGWNGTSMAGPAVSAVVALMKQADSSLSVDELEDVLMNTANPLTDEEYPDSPNNGYGYGLVNAFDAVSSLVSGLGTVEGQVTKEGEDNEAPTFVHESPIETYEGMDLELEVEVADNISVSSVEVIYQDSNGEDHVIEAARISGDYKQGNYAVIIPGEHIEGEAITYSWNINDFGNNEVNSESFEVTVLPGITVGYTHDFESTPVGWTSFGENNSWEWGTPESGPESAASGEKLYATNLAGGYDSDANATLVMPPIDLPEEGNTYLQFKQWHELEMYASGRAYDFGHVFISTDKNEWTQLMRVQGESNEWINGEVDLSEYRGQRIYIGFNITSDGSVTKDGWYIDDVALTDESMSPSASLALNKKKESSKTKDNSKIKSKGNIGLGVIKSKEKASKKEKVDPAKIKPILPQKENSPIESEMINPLLLPIGAKVSVIESGRSVNTDPKNGQYNLLHAAGDYTLKAESYGFESKEKNVKIENDQTKQIDFTLEKIEQFDINGKVTDETTNEPVNDATVMVIEDANIAPVQTNEDGSYSLTAYKGQYTLKILASGYHPKEVQVDLQGDITKDIQLEPFYTVPGGEIGYDDGTAENARAFYDANNGWAVKMTLPEGKDTAVVTEGVFKFWDEEFPSPGGTEFAVEVWDASGADGKPGKKIAGPISAEAIRDNSEWTIIDLKEHSITVNDDFYMVYIQTQPNTGAPGLATDESSPNAERSYQLVGGAWSKSPANEGNYMIRARVAYEAVDPVITTPEKDVITNEKDLTIKGTASPTTTVQLWNNGEEAGNSTVGEDGKFAIPTELTEGVNEFQAISLLEGTPVGESSKVKVTLDTKAPELTIVSPVDGEKTNKETVTVEGTVDDPNLATVKVNGHKATVSDGKYSKRIILENGTNTIKVVAKDLAGNKAKNNVTIDVNYTKPVIENLTPTEDKYIKAGESVKIEFDSEPGRKATFFIHMPLTNTKSQISNATELPMMEMEDGHYVGYWTAPSNLKADGGVIEVKVTDTYGNESRKQAKGKLFINMDE
ncbi:S8 family peptidase [Virgibacillus halodenitrificans]|uniref:S8 family peptidase n=1 Tax=Virgibacillus halodenitrificans TaxID=1482 RepID=UPI0023517114|nr:S8 family peptidase [Virgibacillus halodenitrificans]